MKIEDIFSEWAKDSEITEPMISNYSLAVAKLHHKYLLIYTREKLTLEKLKAEYNQLFKLKFQYYNGTLEEEVLIEKNWDPQPLRILKTDIPMYINADQDIIDINLKQAIQKEKVDALSSIIKMIMNMGFQIKNSIEYLKFTNGIL